MRRKTTIALSINGSHELHHALAEEARKRDWQLLDLKLTKFIVPSDPAPAGAIINLWNQGDLAGQCRALNCPMVKLGTIFDRKKDAKVWLNAVVTDPRMDGTVAADYFAARGFKNVAYVGNDPWSGAKPTFDSFESRTRELGGTCHLLQIPYDMNVDKSKRFELQKNFIGDWLLTLPKPVALLTYTDHMASTVCSICLLRGLSVPEEVAILGIGNREAQCDLSPVPLSSIDKNDHQLGVEAMALMDRVIHNREKAVEEVIVRPKGVVERQSTNIMAHADHRVAKTMRFLWDNMELPITVEDVLSEVGGSRRPLEKAFKASIGRGIKEELLRKRLEKGSLLLRDTDMTIAAVAHAVGIQSVQYFHKVFREAYGVRPREFRLKNR